MTPIQSLDLKAAAIGDADLIRLTGSLREKLEQLDSVAAALDELVRASRASVAFQVRPVPFAEAIERADRMLETLDLRRQR